MTGRSGNARKVILLRRKAEAISFLNDLMTGTVCSLEGQDNPPWFTSGTIHRITRVFYDYYAESAAIRWSDGHKFVYANDFEPFQFFWKSDGGYFGRQLSDEETFRFCQLLGVKRYT